VALAALLVAPVDAGDPGVLGEWLEPLAAWLKEPGASGAVVVAPGVTVATKQPAAAAALIDQDIRDLLTEGR
jgi:precorrin-3B methylase